MIFKSKQEKSEGGLKIRLYSKRLYPTICFKYLGVKIDANLSWQCQLNGLSIKLNRDNAILFKIRKYVRPKMLRSIYFLIFEFHLFYCSLICLRILELFSGLGFYKKKRLLESLANLHASPLFKQSSILKFKNKICLENILFVSKSINKLTPSVFNTWFCLSADHHNYEHWL